ncbi:cell division protein FtsB [Pseudaeromonas sharmana]|uniref:Cell division protein FtsB n=1 Tax=Pseudaeromonas sharmana TaxID=328412 RepID=A0ABV8CLV8_9GAMM
MRLFTLVMLLVLAWLQHQLWFGKNGLVEYRQTTESVVRQQADNQQLKERNELLYKEIDDLKSGLEAIEELSRNDLGFIKPNETFYRILPKDGKNAATMPSSLPKSDE